jgi:hypothetical protein
MKLTNQQITTIEQTLVLNGVVYDDIKLELLDHIATEIESIIDESSFHLKKLKKSFRKMEKRTDTSSFGLEITNQFLR